MDEWTKWTKSGRGGRVDKNGLVDFLWRKFDLIILSIRPYFVHLVHFLSTSSVRPSYTENPTKDAIRVLKNLRKGITLDKKLSIRKMIEKGRK